MTQLVNYEKEYQTAKEFAENLMETATSFEEIIHKINSNQDIIKYLVPVSMMKGYHTDLDADTEFKKPFAFKIDYFFLTAYESKISNRHHAPYSGVQNYNGSQLLDNRELAPTHYSGFIAKVGIESSHFYEKHILDRLGLIARKNVADYWSSSVIMNKTKKSSNAIPVHTCYIFLADYQNLTEELFEYILTASDPHSIDIDKNFKIKEPVY